MYVMGPNVVCLAILVILAIVSKAHGRAYGELNQELTFELPDNENICFYEDFEGATRYVFEFDVLAGGANDVDATVTSPNGKVLYKETKAKDGVLIFESSRGVYSFCFSNEFSTFTHKVVYFSLIPEVRKTLAEEGGNDKPTVNTQFEESLESIHEAWLHVSGYQNEYRLNEARGRHMGELLNNRVQWWSALQSCIILLTGISQVMVLRAFFSHKRTASREAPSSGMLENTAL